MDAYTLLLIALARGRKVTKEEIDAQRESWKYGQMMPDEFGGVSTVPRLPDDSSDK